MSAPWWLEPHDLLRQRRLERGLPPVPPPLPPARRLVLQGGALGLLGLALVLLGWLLVAWREQHLQLQVAQLSAVPASLRSLEGRLRQERGQLQQLEQRNAALARALVATRSGSALLTQLVAITPQGVQLSELSVSGRTLSLKGLAMDPGAFARVNAFALLLAGSPLIQPTEVKVIKLSREPRAPAAAPARVPAVRWELSAGLASLSPSQQLRVWQGLEADGMARRLQTLASLGLLP